MKSPNYYSYHVTKDGKVFNKFDKEMKPNLNGKGYLIVGLTTGFKERKKTIAVHRLVALVYIPNPLNFSDVDHIDGNRSNNNIENLRWVTHGENIKHSYELCLRSATGENNARSLFSNQEVHDICYLLSIGKKPPCLRDMGYKYDLIGTIKRRQNWTSISKDYSF